MVCVASGIGSVWTLTEEWIILNLETSCARRRTTPDEVINNLRRPQKIPLANPGKRDEGVRKEAQGEELRVGEHA